MPDVAQRARLGVGGCEPVGPVPLDGASLCDWGAADGGYPNPKWFSVSGARAMSTSAGGSLAERTCIIFAELPDGRLTYVSFWASSGVDIGHHVCSRARNLADRDAVQHDERVSDDWSRSLRPYRCPVIRPSL